MFKLFDRKGKPIKTCYICGLEKEMTWSEFADHIKEHIKNGDVVSNTIEPEDLLGKCLALEALAKPDICDWIAWIAFFVGIITFVWYIIYSVSVVLTML